MRTFIIGIIITLALLSEVQAQDKVKPPIKSGLSRTKSISPVVQDKSKLSPETLSQQLTYYQKKSSYLTKRSRLLTRRVARLNTTNKRLVIKVEALRNDSLNLNTLLQQALTDNQQLVKSYETRIQGLTGELHALQDSLASLRVVKRDLDIIKNYFSSVELAKREYDMPVAQLLQTLNDIFKKENSPYQIKSRSDQELVLTEDFTLKRPTFLFLKESIYMQAEYKLSLKPHPFNEGKTLVYYQGNFQKKEGNTLVDDSQYQDNLHTEKRLFSFIDQAIQSNDLRLKVSSHLR